MIRTQIQLPDDLFARAKKVCERREISMAELARRGLEYILNVYAPASGKETEWHLPKARGLGWQGLNDAQIKEQAQLTSPDVAVIRTRKK